MTVVLRICSFAALAIAIVACGLKTPLPDSAQAKRAILFDVNNYLSQGNCSSALAEVLPLYNSSFTDNDVRMATASVYACAGGFNFFNFLNAASSTTFSSAGVFFELMSKEFPSRNTLADKVVESAGFATDALMAMLSSGQVLVTGDLFNTNTFNTASLLASDRTSDSNEYLFFVSMIGMGGVENRVGASSSGKPTNNPPLPWITSATAGMQTAAGSSTSGCEFASALLNFADSTRTISSQCCNGTNCPVPAVTDVPAYVTNTLNCVANAAIPGESFAQAIYDACNYGCQNIQPTAGNVGAARAAFFNLANGWSNAACGSNTGACALCPILLRNRNNCAGTANDQASCAAAGIINFVNNSAIGWQ